MGGLWCTSKILCFQYRPTHHRLGVHRRPISHSPPRLAHPGHCTVTISSICVSNDSKHFDAAGVFHFRPVRSACCLSLTLWNTIFVHLTLLESHHLTQSIVHVVPSPPSGVRNYLKEALVNIITVHAEVQTHFLNPMNSSLLFRLVLCFFF